MGEKYLSVTQVARLKKVSRAAVHAAILRGALKGDLRRLFGETMYFVDAESARSWKPRMERTKRPPKAGKGKTK